MFFRSALTRLLQTTSSILPDEIAAPTAGSPSRVRTKPNHRRVWGTRPLRTVGDRRKARPHGADARDYAAVFRIFQSAGWAYPFVSWRSRTTGRWHGEAGHLYLLGGTG